MIQLLQAVSPCSYMSRPSSSILRELIPEVAIVVNSSIMLSFYLLQFVYGPKKEIPLLPGVGKNKKADSKESAFPYIQKQILFPKSKYARK